jgi:spore germination protein
MYKRIANVLFPIVAIAFIITGIWGYQQSRQTQALLIKSENQYQRAFHSLSYHIDQLQDELGKSLVMNSPVQLQKSLNTVWRLSYMAQGEVGQLPFSLMPFHKTQGFLNDLGSFAYSISSDPSFAHKGISDPQWKELKRLYQESKAVESNIQQVQAQVLSDRLRWTDAETALVEQNTKHDNVIVDGFQKLEKQVSHFPEIQWGPITNPNEIRAAKPNAAALSGTNISINDAKRKAAEFMGRNDLENISVVKNGNGMPYPSYSVTASSNNGNAYLEMTQKGGHVTWYLLDRKLGNPTLDLQQGQTRAESWLRDHLYRDLQLVSTEQYDGLGVYQFVWAPKGVVNYPEKMIVKVALDNGQIVGLQAKDFVFHQSESVNPTPKLTSAQAKQRVNPHLQIQDENISVVHDDQGKEVLAYTFTGTMDSDTYRVYIDANTGREVGVEKLTK